LNQLTAEISILLLFFVAILGLIFGSFFNVAIYRLPLILFRSWRQEAQEFLQEHPEPLDLPARFNLFLPRSHCVYCQRTLRAWQNIPLFSFILMRGRCACCEKPIPWRYPIVELLSAVLAVIVVVHYGWDWQVWPGLIFSAYCLVMAYIDFDQQFLLDDLTLGLLWIGLLFNLVGFYTTPSAAIIGAVVGYVSLWVVAKVFYWVTKRDGMAYGDFKLFAALGAWLGWFSLPLVLIFACVSGIVVSGLLWLLQRRNLRHPIPFGPYLALPGWVVLLWGREWFPMYYRYYQFW